MSYTRGLSSQATSFVSVVVTLEIVVINDVRTTTIAIVVVLSWL